MSLTYGDKKDLYMEKGLLLENLYAQIHLKPNTVNFIKILTTKEFRDSQNEYNPCLFYLSFSNLSTICQKTTKTKMIQNL